MSETIPRIESGTGWPEEPEKWTIQDIYEGRGESTVYRYKGETVQCRVERALPLLPDDNTGNYLAHDDEIAGVIATLHECRFRVADSSTTASGSKQGPYLWVEGWKDMVGPDMDYYLGHCFRKREQPAY